MVDSSGVIATNYHVIEGARSATVVFHSGKSVKVLGYLAIQPGKDLAIIRTDTFPEPLKPLPLAKRAPLQGDKVMTFGAPLRLSGSVSDGIVSAMRKGTELNDIVTTKLYSDALGYDLDANWVQTSAPISHGNSGGPLVNADGEVVGINTWSLPNSQNVNFAISSSHVKTLLESQNGRIHSLAELPTSREDFLIAEIATQKKIEAEKARAIEDAHKAETAKQLELSRLDSAIAALKLEIQEIEDQGATLVAKREGMFEQARTIERAAQGTANSIAALQSLINNPPAVITADHRDQVQQAMFQLQLLREKYTILGNQYNGLDAGARELKRQLEVLSKTRDDKCYDVRCLQVRYDRLSRGLTSAAVKDAEAAKAWQQLMREMSPADVIALLGRPSETGTGANGHGLVFVYKYTESGTTIEITGTVTILSGKTVSWEEPRWAK